MEQCYIRGEGVPKASSLAAKGRMGDPFNPFLAETRQERRLGWGRSCRYRHLRVDRAFVGSFVLRESLSKRDS